MSTETTNKKIKIDNGTTFGRTYTDKAVDEMLKNAGGGKSVPPTIDLIDFKTNKVKTTITQEEKDNLEKGLYNQVMYTDSWKDFSPMRSPSKLFISGGSYYFTQFKTFANVDGIVSYSSMALYLITIGEKNTSNEYPITVTEEETMDPSILPLPSDASTSTYVLKAVNGTVQ